jgi:hypothetical protein
MGSVTELVTVEESVLRARLAGKSVRRIAHEYGLTIDNVQTIIEKQLPTLDNNLRLRTLQLEIERLDAMQDAIYKSAAVDGDLQAIAVLLRLQERRAAYLGLDHGLQHPRPLPSDESAQSEGTSTDQLLAELDRIAAEGPAPGLRLVTGTPEPAPDPVPDAPDPAPDSLGSQS